MGIPNHPRIYQLHPGPHRSKLDPVQPKRIGTRLLQSWQWLIHLSQVAPPSRARVVARCRDRPDPVRPARSSGRQARPGWPAPSPCEAAAIRSAQARTILDLIEMDKPFAAKQGGPAGRSCCRLIDRAEMPTSVPMPAVSSAHPGDRGVHRRTTRARQDPNAKPCAASNATSSDGSTESSPTPQAAQPQPACHRRLDPERPVGCC